MILERIELHERLNLFRCDLKLCLSGACYFEVSFGCVLLDLVTAVLWLSPLAVCYAAFDRIGRFLCYFTAILLPKICHPAAASRLHADRCCF